MKRIGLLLTVLLFLFPEGVLAQPKTPLVLINRKFRLVELARSQRATLTYDISSIGGQHLAVSVYRHDQTLNEEPLKKWLFHGSRGSERLSFDALPLAVYTLVAYASDEKGSAVAQAAPLIHVEYGGWRAWEAFKPPVETVEEQPEAFKDVSVATSTRNVDVGIAISPQAVVIKPGGTVEFKPAFRNMEPEPVTWKLVGDGKLTKGEGDRYIYTAPKTQLGTKLFRIEIQSSAHPDLSGAATVLVTNASQDQIERGQF